MFIEKRKYIDTYDAEMCERCPQLSSIRQNNRIFIRVCGNL